MKTPRGPRQGPYDVPARLCDARFVSAHIAVAVVFRAHIAKLRPIARHAMRAVQQSFVTVEAERRSVASQCQLSSQRVPR
jgi:hypothetical protein